MTRDQVAAMTVDQPSTLEGTMTKRTSGPTKAMGPALAVSAVVAGISGMAITWVAQGVATSTAAPVASSTIPGPVEGTDPRRSSSTRRRDIPLDHPAACARFRCWPPARLRIRRPGGGLCTDDVTAGFLGCPVDQHAGGGTAHHSADSSADHSCHGGVRCRVSKGHSW